ncbi:MAG: hypothetical protein ACI8UO_000848 [Verrucomicrobiales bacterium]|jgi:hypothetical protein
MNLSRISALACVLAALIHPASAETVELQIQNVKLKNIIVPEVELDATPLNQAIEFLRTKSVELDSSEPDPAKKGINIILLRGAQPKTDSEDGEPLITLRARNMSLGAILRYVAQIAGCEIDVHPEAVVIGTPEELGQLRGMFKDAFANE